ncbi:MAG: ComEC/Rec2 family competence protein [Anaerolineales bacterium]
MTPLVIFTAAWALGILLAWAALFHPVWFLLSLPLALAIDFGWRHERRGRLLIWALAGLSLGAGRFVVSRPRFDATHVVHYNDLGELDLVGVVVGEPDRRATHTQLRLVVEEAHLPSGEVRPVHGRVLVRAPVYTPAFHGDRVRVTGTLETPPVFERFSYRDHLARQKIHSLLRRADVVVLTSHVGFRPYESLLRFKFFALERLHRVLPEPQSSLLAGILLGIESGIPASLNDDFAATGTSHIVAISGFNIAIVAGMLAQVAQRLGRGRGETLLALGGVTLYTLFVGASAAVLRAAVMGSVTVLARTQVSRQHPPTTLAFAVLFMSALNPFVLWDVGFQLSLAATAGLIFFTEPLTRCFRRGIERFTGSAQAERIVGLLSDALIVTLAAQITTTPILVAKFQRLSLVTLLTNFLILPAQPLVMATGALTLLAALLWLPLGQIVAWSAWAFLSYTIALVRWTADIPFASVGVGRLGTPLVWGYYLALGGGAWWLSRSPEERRRWRQRVRALPRWQLVGGLILAVLVGGYVSALPDGRLHVLFLAVEGGEPIFVQTPTGRQVLIDGGSEPRELLAEVGRRMPFWDRHIDLVVLTSPDDERLAGLVPLLERYDVEHIAMGPEAGAGPYYERWTALLEERAPGTVSVLRAGVTWELDPEVELRVLWPPPYAPPAPLVLQIVHGESVVLLPGAATTRVEDALVEGGVGLESAVLLVPRGGAKTALSPDFLRAVAPEVTVISAGKRGPAPQVLARLMDLPVYRTDLQGTVEIISDGRRLRVRPSR